MTFYNIRDSATLLDRIEAGLLSQSEFEQEVIDEVYGGLAQYCAIPDGYTHCQLGTEQMDLEALDNDQLHELLECPPDYIINPYPVHGRAIEFFRMLIEGNRLVCDHHNPLLPTVGAYLYGPPGVGKTHIMAAYGLQVQELMAEKLVTVKKGLGDLISQAFERYSTSIAGHEVKDTNPDDNVGWMELSDERIKATHAPKEQFWADISDLKHRIQQYTYQPTDMLYLGFKELYEICRTSDHRSDAMNAIDNARIVFVDDIHPQGDLEQVHIVLHLLERRYELGRAGTFLTTNLDTTALGGGDQMLGQRLTSRCAETLVTFDFKDCDDWRTKIKSQRIRLIESAIDSRVASATARSGSKPSLDQADEGYTIEELDDP
jgi:hypothetical protein|tara:strand:- start:29513 stop:30637 length:1125 start_codon:yes stop_codon:yes gene_type:complete